MKGMFFVICVHLRHLRIDITEVKSVAIFYDNPVLRDYWYAVATEAEIADQPVARALLGENIVIYRDSAGAAIAAPDRCPHRQAPLSAGSVEKGVLTCCYHGWSYGSGGKCVAIPSADPAFPIPANAHLACFNTSIKYGLVWVCPGDSPKQLPAIAEEQDRSFRRINNPVDLWQVCAMRMTDNFLDISHFPWVHTGTFGNNQRRSVPEIELEMLEGGYYGYKYQVAADNPPGAELSSGNTGEVVSRQMTTGFHLPFTVRSTITYDSGLQHIMLLLTAPIDDLTSYFTFVVWRNDDFSVSAEDIIAFDRMIGEEDKRMLEKIPEVLPFSPQALANSQADKPSVAWRHQFTRLLGAPMKASACDNVAPAIG